MLLPLKITKSIGIKALSVVTASVFLFSCGSVKLETSSVCYQSIRTAYRQPTEIPQNAQIQLTYLISDQGNLTVVVTNLTDKIMSIDQTKSFFVNTNGQSVSYFDPTVRTSTVTDISSGTKGMGVNLGAVGSALGIGGAFGTLLNGVNVGGSSTNGQSIANTTYLADQPVISLGPKGQGALTHEYAISGIGVSGIPFGAPESFRTNMTQSTSNLRFSVCISYSFEGDMTPKKMVTDFFVNANIVSLVRSSGKVNNALKRIYEVKSDALNEQCFILYFNTNLKNDGTVPFFNTYSKGILFDYQ